MQIETSMPGFGDMYKYFIEEETRGIKTWRRLIEVFSDFLGCSVDMSFEIYCELENILTGCLNKRIEHEKHYDHKYASDAQNELINLRDILIDIFKNNKNSDLESLREYVCNMGHPYISSCPDGGLADYLYGLKEDYRKDSKYKPITTDKPKPYFMDKVTEQEMADLMAENIQRRKMFKKSLVIMDSVSWNRDGPKMYMPQGSHIIPEGYPNTLTKATRLMRSKKEQLDIEMKRIHDGIRVVGHPHLKQKPHVGLKEDLDMKSLYVTDSACADVYSNVLLSALTVVRLGLSRHHKATSPYPYTSDHNMKPITPFHNDYPSREDVLYRVKESIVRDWPKLMDYKVLDIITPISFKPKYTPSDILTPWFNRDKPILIK